MPLQSPFHDVHVNSRAQLTERHGWLIPDHYGDPQQEFQQCSEHLGVFDTSWQYRIRAAGSDAGRRLANLLDDDIAQLPVNHHRRLEKTKLDDDLSLTVQHQDKGYVLIGHPKDHRRLIEILESPGDVTVADETAKTAMVTLIGPSAWNLLSEKLPFEVDHLEPGQLLAQTYLFFRFIISRDTIGDRPAASIILPAKMASLAWDMLVKYGQAYSATLAGFETYCRIHNNGADRIE